MLCGDFENKSVGRANFLKVNFGLKLQLCVFIFFIALINTPKPLTEEQILECYSKNIFEIQNDPVCKQLTKE